MIPNASKMPQTCHVSLSISLIFHDFLPFSCAFNFRIQGILQQLGPYRRRPLSRSQFVSKQIILDSNSNEKHSPPGHKFHKSEGPPIAVIDNPFHQVVSFQIVSKWRILDSYPYDFQRRFQLYPSKVVTPIAHDGEPPQFYKNLEYLEKSELLESRFMKSCDIKCYPWGFLMPQVVSLHVMVNFQEHWF